MFIISLLPEESTGEVSLAVFRHFISDHLEETEARSCIEDLSHNPSL
jgi:hypothetical protein